MAEVVDLELSLERGSETPYAAEVRVRFGDDSELRHGPYPVRIEPGELAALLDRPEAYSQTLTAGLFADARLRAAFVEGRVRADALNEPLRLRLHIAESAAELHGLAWELLYDPDLRYLLSIQEWIHFSRYLAPEGGDSVPLPRPRGMLHALAAAANPSNLGSYRLERLDVAKELSRAGHGLAPLRVDRLPAAVGDFCTLPRLIERARGVDVLYLACHGVYRRKTAALFLEGDDGKVKRVTGQELAERLGALETRPRLVVLASCESAGAGAGEALLAAGPLLVAAGVPAVIAMQGPVSMETMDAFLPVFFRELAQDGRIDRAMAAARLAVRDRLDWWAPALWMNLLSGRLWKEEPIPPGPALNLLEAPREVPAPPANLIGRDVELAELEAALDAGRRVINLHGTGGVGKTATARELVRRVQHRFPDGQVNLDMQGAGGRLPVTAAQALAYVIQKFDPSITQLPADEQLLRGRYQSLLNGRRALILIDNVGDENQVRPFFPPPEGCLLLLTTLGRLDSADVEVFNRRLGKLSPADAERLLVLLAPRAASHAALLAERCDYLPQALDQVARRINKSPGLAIEDLLALLEDVEQRLEIFGVDAMLKVSYDMLTPDQQSAWRTLAVFSGDFDVMAAAWVWGRVNETTSAARLRTRVIRARLDLDDLLGYGLLEHDARSDRYQLHNLERLFAAGLAEFAVEEPAVRLAHARCYLDVLARANSLYLQGNQRSLEGLALFDREVREIRSAWDWISEGEPLADGSTERARQELRARYPAVFATLMGLRLLPEERVIWLTTGLAAAGSLGDRSLEVILVSSLGAGYYVMERNHEALACQLQALVIALELARKSEGGDCLPLVRVLGNLGALYRVMGQRQRALRYLNKGLDLARRLEDRREEGRALGSLGRVYFDLGAMPRAIEYFHAELQVAEATGDRRGQAIALGGLGNSHRLLKDFEEARQYLERDLAITQEIGDRRGQASASWLLGKVYHDQEDLSNAVRWMQVLVDYEREIGHQDADWRAEAVAEIQARMLGE